MGMYILQTKVGGITSKQQWIKSGFGPFDTLEEAKACLAKRRVPEYYRIAEVCTVIRYKPVKL